MMKIYTKTGDKGQTALVSGKRISKDDNRIELYGEVDELNSFIGVVVSKAEVPFLKRIQNELFNLGSLLACESENWAKFNLPVLSESIVQSIEEQIDEIQKELPALKNFILPGGSEASAATHVCRVVCRRVERNLISFARENSLEIPEQSICFLNRLSDYFFVLARKLNKDAKVSEIIWRP
jgi:cob(I)alamin adenosyltransferase